jgi:hypothetical protein
MSPGKWVRLRGAVALGGVVTVALSSMGGCELASDDARELPVANSDSMGSLRTEFTLSGGETISSLAWTIAEGAATVLSGTYTVPADATALAFEIGDVPSGSGYTLGVTAQSADGTVMCVGTSAPFTVTARNTTQLHMNLLCSNPSAFDAGNLVVTGSPVNCALLTSAAATPTSMIVGGLVNLAAGAVAPDAGAIAFTWSPSAGSISPQTPLLPGEGVAAFNCPATPQTVTINVSVSDGPVPAGLTCPFETTTLSVTCTPGVSVAVRSAVNAGGAGTEALALPATAAVGDLLVVVATPFDTGSFTATVSSGSGGAFSTVQAGNNNGQYLAVFSKPLVAGDIGSPVTVKMAGGSERENATLIDVYSPLGATPYVDSSAIGGAPAGATATAPPVTTTAPGELVLLAAMQSGGTVATLPSNVTKLTNNGSFVTGDYTMATQGTTPTLQLKNGGNFPWEIAQIAIGSN